MKQLISLNQVNKSYQDGFKKKQIIHSLSFDIVEQEVFGFIGPSPMWDICPKIRDSTTT